MDVSAAMLTLIEEKAERLDIKNIERVQGGFLTYDHRGEPADFVYSRNALHHLPDFSKALALERISSILRSEVVLRLHYLAFSFDPVAGLRSANTPKRDGAMVGFRLRREVREPEKPARAGLLLVVLVAITAGDMVVAVLPLVAGEFRASEALVGQQPDTC